MAFSLYQAFGAETSEKSSAVYVDTSAEMVPSLKPVARRQSASLAGDGCDPSLPRVFCRWELQVFCSSVSHCQSTARVTVVSCGYRHSDEGFKQILSWRVRPDLPPDALQ